MNLPAGSISKCLPNALLQTAVYADVFDFPLHLTEIHRYLIGCRASLVEVRACLDEQGVLVEVDGFYTLPGREGLAGLRRRREAHARRLWPRAAAYGRLIARLPFVHMVAVTGALAVNNTGPEADVDYLLVTEPGRLWSCRAMVLLLGRVAASQGVALCPNYMVTTRQLVFSDQTLYTAHEIAQMIPLSGFEVYERIREQNAWMADFLPNAEGMPLLPGVIRQLPPASRAQRLAEAALRAKPFTWLEAWEMKRKITRLQREQGDSPESQFSADCCKGHDQRHQGRTVEALNLRLQRLQVQPVLEEAAP